MKIELPCQKCDGAGEIECCECENLRDCPQCEGAGTISSLGDFVIPDRHKNTAAQELLMADFHKCIADHEKLCILNPRAKDSYDEQLAATVQQLTEQVKALLE